MEDTRKKISDENLVKSVTGSLAKFCDGEILTIFFVIDFDFSTSNNFTWYFNFWFGF